MRAQQTGSATTQRTRVHCFLGHGLRLWESPDELTDRYHLERVPSPSGVVHHFFWRR